MKYDNTPYPRPDYIKEVESRLNALVINSYKNRESDPESSMNNARKAAEAICRCTILKHNLTKYDNVPRELDSMIGLLRKHTQAMPRTILLHTETLQKWGNVGSHFHTTSLTPDDIASAMMAMKSLVDWFYSENKLGKAPSEPKPAEPEVVEPASDKVKVIESEFVRSEPTHARPKADKVVSPYEVDESAYEEEAEYEPEYEFKAAYKHKPASRTLNTDKSGRLVTTNFYLDIEFTSQHGTLTFRSPDSSLSENPVYAAVKSSYFFDFDELFSAVTDVVASLLKLEPEDIVIHYSDPDELQLCAPEFLYDDDSPNAEATIPFDISYYKSTRSRRTKDFSLYLNSYIIGDESLRLYFPPRFLLYPPKEKKLLSYYGINGSSFWMDVSRLIRLAHPTYYANVNPDFSLPDTILLGTEDPVQLSLGYSLEIEPRSFFSPEHAARELYTALYERDDAKASLTDATTQAEKSSRYLIILFILHFIGMITLIMADDYSFMQTVIGTLLNFATLIFMFFYFRS